MDQDKVDSLMNDLEDTVCRVNLPDMDVCAYLRVQMAVNTPELKAAAAKLLMIRKKRKAHRDRMNPEATP